MGKRTVKALPKKTAAAKPPAKTHTKNIAKTTKKTAPKATPKPAKKVQSRPPKKGMAAPAKAVAPKKAPKEKNRRCSLGLKVSLLQSMRLLRLGRINSRASQIRDWRTCWGRICSQWLVTRTSWSLNVQTEPLWAAFLVVRSVSEAGSDLMI